jgi:hypothetical protein
VQYKQHDVIEFLVAKEESVINIHKYLYNIYGSAMIDTSTVGFWVKRVTASKTGKVEFRDLLRSGCPVTAVSPEILLHADTVIYSDR